MNNYTELCWCISRTTIRNVTWSAIPLHLWLNNSSHQHIIHSKRQVIYPFTTFTIHPYT